MKTIQCVLTIFFCCLFLRIQAQNYSAPTGAGSSGTDNTSLGTSAGSNGTNNTAVGKQAGDVVTGSHNSFFGKDSGKANTTASSNTFMGVSSGLLTTTGGSNTFLGFETGRSNVTGTGNVFIGYQAGYSETGSNKLYIDNSNVSTPLIYGDFSTNKVGINALPTGTYTLNIGGTLNATGIFINNQAFTSSQWTSSGNNLNFNTGIVSIGTTTAPAGYKLAIGGKVVAEEVVVKLQANWPDYVFDKGYQLPSLEELQLFIAQHKHLPGVPSAKEIQNNGVSVGEMNAILLKKIEELTVYLLNQQKEIEELKKKIN